MLKRFAVIGLILTVPAVVAAPAVAADDAIRWHRCGPDLPAELQCGSLAVPLDYGHPDGAKITLGFNRLRALDRAHRVGSLIVNPGGPGVAGTDAVAVEAAGGQLWDPALRRRFDLIGMDPRGVGTSTPVQCDPAVYNRPVSLFPRTAAEFDQVTNWASAFGKSCLKLTGPLLGHLDATSVAQDMEQLRRALDDGKLNFLGLSYGAGIGSAYAELYPKRIRAMALDAITNPSSTINTLFAQHGLAYEDAFNRFAAWCAQTETCALHGSDVGARFDALVARADQQPIPAPGCEPGVCRPTVSGGQLRMNLFNLLLFKNGVPALGAGSWSDFADALLSAEQGDATAFAEYLAQGKTGFAAIAVNCVDYPWKAFTFDQYAAKSLLGRVLAPHTQGASEAWTGYLACSRWPVAPVRRQPVDVRDAPPILLVGSTHDPSTPYSFAHELQDSIAGSVLLTRDGDSHTTSWNGPGRARDAIARYLITLQTPAPNTVYPD